MRTLKIIVMVSVLLWQATSWAQTNTKEVPIYTQDKPAIQVAASQPQFTVKLKSNPTTGYAWFLRGYDSSLLVPVKHSFEAPTGKKLMGAPGAELWTFRVKSAGFTVPQQTQIRFIYSRPWQANDGATQVVFQVTTVVENHN